MYFEKENGKYALFYLGLRLTKWHKSKDDARTEYRRMQAEAQHLETGKWK